VSLVGVQDHAEPPDGARIVGACAGFLERAAHLLARGRRKLLDSDCREIGKLGGILSACCGHRRSGQRQPER
jgi:hypothetical protein